MFKRDLKKAYRQINIDPKDVRKVGFRWKNQIFMDKVVPMGSRTGAYICQRTTNAICFMYEHSGFQVINYIDDFAGAETVDKASEAFSCLGHLLKVLGVKESEDKSCAPSTEMSFLGILFNSHIWQSLSLRDWRWKAAVTLGWMGATFSGSSSWPPRSTISATLCREFWGGRWKHSLDDAGNLHR